MVSLAEDIQKRLEEMRKNFEEIVRNIGALIVGGCIATVVVLGAGAYVWLKSEHHSSSHSHSSGPRKFVVRYLDGVGKEHTEEIEDDIAFYQRVRREGFSVISIHKLK